MSGSEPAASSSLNTAKLSTSGSSLRAWTSACSVGLMSCRWSRSTRISAVWALCLKEISLRPFVPNNASARRHGAIRPGSSGPGATAPSSTCVAFQYASAASQPRTNDMASATAISTRLRSTSLPSTTNKFLRPSQTRSSCACPLRTSVSSIGVTALPSHSSVLNASASKPTVGVGFQVPMERRRMAHPNSLTGPSTSRRYASARAWAPTSASSVSTNSLIRAWINRRPWRSASSRRARCESASSKTGAGASSSNAS